MPARSDGSEAKEGRFRRLVERSIHAARLGVAWFPLSLLGLLTLATGVFALRWYAYGQLDLTLLVIGYAAVGLCAFTLLFVLGIALWLQWRGQPSSAQRLLTETGRSTETGFRLPALRFIPFVQLRWTWSTPTGVHTEPQRHGAWQGERMVPSARGQHREIVRRVQVQDPFGLARVHWSWRQSVELDVLPHLGALRRLPMLTSFAHGDELPHPLGVAEGDRMELRRYVAGDPARFIHWRVYARTRKLMVRHPERALTPARRTAAFLVAGPGDESTAAVARMALEQDLLGEDWVFGTDRDPHGTSELGEALAFIMRSPRATDRAGSGLAAFLAQVRKMGPASALLFLPPIPGPWVDAVVAAARAHRAPVRVVIGIDGVREPPKARPWLRWFMRPVRPVEHDADQLRIVLQRMQAAGCETLVVDRVSGRALSPGHLRRPPAASQPQRSKAA